MNEYECISAAKGLLAVMHRDGGHHTGNVGFAKSCQDAELVYRDLMIDKAALMHANVELARLLMLYVENTHGVPVSVDGRALRECALEELERHVAQRV